MNTMPASTDFGLPVHLGRTFLSSLSWSKEEGERLRLTVITVMALLLFVPLALVIPGLDVPKPERTEAESLPPQLAKLLVKPQPIEKPAIKPVEVPAPPEPKPAEPEPAEPEPVASKPKPVRQVEKPKAQPAPARQSLKPVNQSVEQAREKASRSGLLTMKDRLASMRRPAPETAPVIQANAGKVSGADDSVKTGAQYAGDALQGSGGVKDPKAIQADVEVAGHEVRNIEAAPKATAALASAPAPKKEPSVGERAMSNIRQVFDSGKTALYALYQRELRQDPTLTGKVLLELVIEPDGSVSACKVVSSELESPVLEQKIAMRVRLFNFGAEKVEARKVRFPIDFLPG
jgi:outer membrane biosynthesis protein TonB